MNYGEDPTEDMWSDYDHNQNTGELDDLFEEQPYTDNNAYSNTPPARDYNQQAKANNQHTGTGCLTFVFFFFALWLVIYY
ncbi:MAG: hypothetical protein Q3992_02870 [Bacteroides sp.]|nr:hypothetical protein [Bacteroides sp.]